MQKPINITADKLIGTIAEAIIKHSNLAPIDYQEEISKHTYIEFRLDEEVNSDNFAHFKDNRDKLWEEHGCIPDLVSYVNDLKQSVVNSYSGKKFFSTIVTEKDFANVPNPFFTKIQVSISGTIGEDKRTNEILGGYMYKRSGYVADDKNEITGYNVSIIINEKGSTFEELIKNICKSFAHELTHAYDDYNRKTRVLNGENVPSIRQYSQLSGQANAQQILSKGIDDIEFRLSQILYFTNKIENNGFNGGLKQELRTFSDEIVDTQSGVYVLKKTETWQEYEQTKENLSLLSSLLNDDDSISFDARKTICKAFKKIICLDYTYPQIIKYLRNRFLRTEKKLIRNAYKQVFDVYKEKNDSGILIN